MGEVDALAAALIGCGVTVLVLIAGIYIGWAIARKDNR